MSVSLPPGRRTRAPAARVPSSRAAPEPPPSASRTVRESALALAALASACAGAMHLKAAVEHVDHYWLYGLFFFAIGVAQLIWARIVHRGRADRRVLLLGAWGNLAIVLVWLTTRTIGAPLGPWAWDAEPAGAIDLIATADELVVVATVLALVRSPDADPPRLRWLRAGNAMRFGVALASVSLFAALIGGHSHS